MIWIDPTLRLRRWWRKSRKDAEDGQSRHPETQVADEDRARQVDSVVEQAKEATSLIEAHTRRLVRLMEAPGHER